MSRDSRMTAFYSREREIQRRWSVGKGGPERWQIIRDAYSLRLPSILMTGCSPYFLPWDFTQIEDYAWQDIRGMGLRLYPQFPALGYFLDFADPILQIGVELDGKNFHDAKRDLHRDTQLWEQGWRIFRIPGRESLPAPLDPRDVLPELDSEGSQVKYDAFYEWGARWSTGFFWALAAVYYGRQLNDDGLLDPAYRILDGHRLVSFPLNLDEEAE